LRLGASDALKHEMNDWSPGVPPSLSSSGTGGPQDQPAPGMPVSLKSGLQFRPGKMQAGALALMTVSSTERVKLNAPMFSVAPELFLRTMSICVVAPGALQAAWMPTVPVSQST
jgi:hypothetical protein